MNAPVAAKPLSHYLPGERVVVLDVDTGTFSILGAVEKPAKVGGIGIRRDDGKSFRDDGLFYVFYPRLIKSRGFVQPSAKSPDAPEPHVAGIDPEAIDADAWRSFRSLL